MNPAITWRDSKGHVSTANSHSYSIASRQPHGIPLPPYGVMNGWVVLLLGGGGGGGFETVQNKGSLLHPFDHRPPHYITHSLTRSHSFTDPVLQAEHRGCCDLDASLGAAIYRCYLSLPSTTCPLFSF